MYVTDVGVNPKIEKCEMAFEDACKTIISSNIIKPRGITIGSLLFKIIFKNRIMQAIILDFLTQRVYWTDGSAKHISSVNLEGGDRKVLLTGILDAPSPYWVSIYQDRAYYGDWQTRSIRSADKINGGFIHNLFRGLTNPRQMRIYDPITPRNGKMCFALG